MSNEMKRGYLKTGTDKRGYITGRDIEYVAYKPPKGGPQVRKGMFKGWCVDCGCMVSSFDKGVCGRCEGTTLTDKRPDSAKDTHIESLKAKRATYDSKK